MRIGVRTLTLVSVLLLSASFTLCSGGQTTEGGVESKSRDFALNQANQALAELAYSPSGQGWEYKATATPGADFNSWATKFKSQIQQAIDAVGEGYQLQVTGHTCSIGPRTAPGDGRKGNEWYSAQRATGVKAALQNQGISVDKLAVKGVADDEPISGLDPKDQKNRRVTFKIIKKP